MERVLQYFGLVMVLLYLSIGIAIMRGANSLFQIPDQYSILTGLLLIAYGIYRAYRIFQKFHHDS